MSRGSVLALVGLACLFGFASALDHTHIDNHLNVAIFATLDYDEGVSSFQHRRIPSGSSGRAMPRHAHVYLLHLFTRALSSHAW